MLRFALLLFATLSAAQSTTKPNILFLVIDDLGMTDLSYKGAEYSTPVIDELARNGIDFTRYYTHEVCTPTRAAIMTGKYAWKTGLQMPDTLMPTCTGHIPFDTPTLAELLKKQGYETHMMGKWHLG